MLVQHFNFEELWIAAACQSLLHILVHNVYKGKGLL